MPTLRPSTATHSPLKAQLLVKLLALIQVKLWKGKPQAGGPGPILASHRLTLLHPVLCVQLLCPLIHPGSAGPG